MRDRPAGQRAELPGQARPEDANPEFRLKKMEDSLWEQATESDWSEEERRQWYRERPKDEEYIQRELLNDGLTRKAKLTQLPPHEEGQPTLWAIGIEGPSPLRLPEAELQKHSNLSLQAQKPCRRAVSIKGS